jgi:hypothetical protein
MVAYSSDEVLANRGASARRMAGRKAAALAEAT